MAPKRKRAQDLETPVDSTRPTRSSTRITENHSEKATAKKATTNNKKAATSKQVVAEDGVEAGPLAKKPRNTKAAKASQVKKMTRTGSASLNDEAGPSATVPTVRPSRSISTVYESTSPQSKNNPSSQAQLPPGPEESYAPVHALALFQKYADCEDPETIGPEGFTQLCADAQIPMEGARPLILAWQLNATEMGKFTKDQWIRGTTTLRISSLSQLAIAVAELENLLILDAEPVKTLSKKKNAPLGRDSDSYDRSQYRTYVSNRKDGFTKLYSFCFALAKPPPARNIDIETATAFWSVLLSPRYTIMNEVVEFINEKGTYKGANKDLWNMMLEFCQNVRPTLEDYEADGAWPTLLDDFVSWKKSKVAIGETSIADSDGKEP